MALYADEVTPGNVLAHDNLRKLWVLYWGVLELSQPSLYNEDAWFLLSAKRTSEVVKIPGAISALIASALKLFFSGAANDLSTVGMLLEFPDGHSARVWFELDQIIQDDAAHKFILKEAALVVHKVISDQGSTAFAAHASAVAVARAVWSF